MSGSTRQRVDLAELIAELREREEGHRSAEEYYRESRDPRLESPGVKVSGIGRARAEASFLRRVRLVIERLRCCPSAVDPFGGTMQLPITIRSVLIDDEE